MPIVQQIEVNVTGIISAPGPVPPPSGAVIKIRNGEKCEYKKVVLNTLGKGKILLLPCNSFWVYWSDVLGKHRSRVFLNYSDQHEGTPFNHKKIDTTVVFFAQPGN